MAAAARCLRPLSRSTALKHLSSSLAKNASQSSSRGTSTSLLKSYLSTDSGLLKGTRTFGMSTSTNFSKRFAPVSFVCSITKACPLSIDAGNDGSDVLDGNLGDDDGDTWSHNNDDEPYLDGT